MLIQSPGKLLGRAAQISLGGDHTWSPNPWEYTDCTRLCVCRSHRGQVSSTRSAEPGVASLGACTLFPQYLGTRLIRDKMRVTHLSRQLGSVAYHTTTNTRPVAEMWKIRKFQEGVPAGDTSPCPDSGAGALSSDPRQPQSTDPVPFPTTGPEGVTRGWPGTPWALDTPAAVTSFQVLR